MDVDAIVEEAWLAVQGRWATRPVPRVEVSVTIPEAGQTGRVVFEDRGPGLGICGTLRFRGVKVAETEI